MSRPILDPADYARRICVELGQPREGLTAYRGNSEKMQAPNTRRKRRLFLRMYQYRGESFVIRAYERILGRHPDASELDAAQEAFFRERTSRTLLMLALRFSEEGRLLKSCNLIGLSALRIFWNATHPRNRRIFIPRGSGRAYLKLPQ